MQISNDTPTVKNTVQNKTKKRRNRTEGESPARHYLHANLAWRNAGSPYTTDCLFGPHSHSGIRLRFFFSFLSLLCFSLSTRRTGIGIPHNELRREAFPFFVDGTKHTTPKRNQKTLDSFCPSSTHAHTQKQIPNGQTAQISRFVALLLRRLDFSFQIKKKKK